MRLGESLVLMQLLVDLARVRKVVILGKKGWVYPMGYMTLNLIRMISNI
jgi:hypothetical protein